VNDYHALRDYLKKQKLPEFVLSFEHRGDHRRGPAARGRPRRNGMRMLEAGHTPAKEIMMRIMIEGASTAT